MKPISFLLISFLVFFFLSTSYSSSLVVMYRPRSASSAECVALALALGAGLEDRQGGRAWVAMETMIFLVYPSLPTHNPPLRGVVLTECMLGWVLCWVLCQVLRE